MIQTESVYKSLVNNRVQEQALSRSIEEDSGLSCNINIITISELVSVHCTSLDQLIIAERVFKAYYGDSITTLQHTHESLPEYVRKGSYILHIHPDFTPDLDTCMRDKLQCKTPSWVNVPGLIAGHASTHTYPNLKIQFREGYKWFSYTLQLFNKYELTERGKGWHLLVTTHDSMCGKPTIEYDEFNKFRRRETHAWYTTHDQVIAKAVKVLAMAKKADYWIFDLS